MKREIDWQKGDGLVPAIVVDGDGGRDRQEQSHALGNLKATSSAE